MENQNNIERPLVISYLTIRKSIGILGITLPAILLLGTVMIGKCCNVQNSVSDYYFTAMGDVFVGILCFIALFLISYRGYDKIDNIATNLAGFFALVVAFFPTDQNPDIGCTIRHLDDCCLRSTLHFTSAALFFVTLASISFFLFTKSKSPVDKHDKKSKKYLRNNIYKSCAIVIIISLALIAIFHLPTLKEIMVRAHLTFWFEWMALLAFGTSWLIKGEFLFRDGD